MKLDAGQENYIAGMRAVARATHDTVVELDEDMHLYTPAADLHPLFAETLPEAQFQDLLARDDQRRFRTAVNLASVSQQPRVLTDVTLAQMKCELLVAECGNGYLIGIRIKRVTLGEKMCSRHLSNNGRPEDVYSRWDSDMSLLTSQTSSVYIPMSDWDDNCIISQDAAICCRSSSHSPILTSLTSSQSPTIGVAKTLSNTVTKMGRSRSSFRRVKSGPEPKSDFYGVVKAQSSNSLTKTSRSGGKVRRSRSGPSMSSIMHVPQSPLPHICDSYAETEFVPTPFTACYKSVLMTMKHWNLPAGAQGRTCCKWHSAVDMLSHVIDKISKTSCDTEWLCFASWQCGCCKCLNGSSLECDVCGAIMPD